MPEYLAPGVYVEETSFRSKPIEGVSTSTTGFVGPCRKGPVGDTPELITSFGEFERVFGGFASLSLAGPGARQNYLAHAVNGYFENGGRRLYVSRTYTPVGSGEAEDGIARSSAFAETTPGQSARFTARFAGAAGNGRITLREEAVPATWRTMDNAPEGAMVQVGGESPSTAGQLEGGYPTFQVTHNGVLSISIDGGADEVITFVGNAAVVQTSTAVESTVSGITDTDNTLSLRVNGVVRTIRFSVGDLTQAEILAEANKLPGIRAELVSNQLVLTTDMKGSGSSLEVITAPTFLVFSETSSPADTTSNVADLDKVTVSEIAALFADEGSSAVVSISPSTGKLRIASNTTGTTSSITINTPAGSVHSELGFGTTLTDTGEDGDAAAAFYVKSGSSWTNETTTLSPATTDEIAPTAGAWLLSLVAETVDADGHAVVFDGMGYDDEYPGYIGDVMSTNPSKRMDWLEHLFAIEIEGEPSAFDLRDGLLKGGTEAIHELTGGSDGAEPTPTAYKSALEMLALVDGISIVAAPGASATSSASDMNAITNHLLVHAEGGSGDYKTKYRMAVVDPAPELSLSEVGSFRSRIDSKYAALYYPWIVVTNPLARPMNATIPKEVAVPPSGHICGIYARNDTERGVHKAPANEVVRGALRFDSNINFAQQEVLNPQGINCLRFFNGRGNRVWGARIVTSDGEWKYVNIRRYFNYLEASIDRGTQWAVFEPNGERLWADIKQSIDEFLYNEWRSGALLGTSPKEAYFIRCDRSTMTQNDLDNGRLICEIGVAAVKPAEFVIFRIGQKTADARS